MIRQIILFFIAFFSVASFASTHVAVLETISEKDIIGRSEKVFLTDKLREMAKTVLPDYMGYVIMTRENINAMLPPGKSVEECEGSCLVETGKNIAADFVAQARVGKFEKQLTLVVEIYETSGGNLIGSFTTRKPNAEGLLEEIENKADSLFLKILGYASSAPKKEDQSKKVVDDNFFTDLRDGQKYKTVKISDQIWMAENLNFKPKDGLLKKKSWCYGDRNENCEMLGRLYTWGIAKDVCPAGWHLPTKKDYEDLFISVGGDSLAGKKLKSEKGWKDGENSDGFSVLPSGLGGQKVDVYGGIEGFSYYWTSTEFNRTDSYNIGFVFDSDDVKQGHSNKLNRFSVRCVKNESAELKVFKSLTTTYLNMQAAFFLEKAKFGSFREIGFSCGKSLFNCGDSNAPKGISISPKKAIGECTQEKKIIILPYADENSVFPRHKCMVDEGCEIFKSACERAK